MRADNSMSHPLEATSPFAILNVRYAEDLLRPPNGLSRSKAVVSKMTIFETTAFDPQQPVEGQISITQYQSFSEWDGRGVAVATKQPCDSKVVIARPVFFAATRVA